jgi:outer membrane protein OmpA-like peptidoglycan-associated protein
VWAAALALTSAIALTSTTPSDSSAASDAATTSSTTATNTGVTADASTTPYPLGVPDSSEPSGYAPPGADAMPGYSLTYSNDFTGTSLPSGWYAFSGSASGDAGSLWAPSQVTVSGGMAQLLTSQLAADNDAWVGGGMSLGSEPMTYGAFFVRSRMTGVGPTQVELLWPTSGWPPEIDFVETYGGDTSQEATLHYTSANLQIYNTIDIDMTQWHTWGIVWTPDSIIYTVDGNEWASINIPADIPDQPMTLNIQQQTWCASGFACPTAPESTDVDWVAIYSPTSSSAPPTTTTTAASSPPGPPAPGGSSTTTTTSTTSTTTTTTTVTSAPTTPAVANGPTADAVVLNSFGKSSTSLSRVLRVKVARLASVILRDNDSEVTLTGYSSDVRTRSSALEIARARAVSVEDYLQEQLALLHYWGVKIFVRGVISGGDSVTANARSSSVVALLR